jgi:DNA-binding transcriptional MerR regulator
MSKILEAFRTIGEVADELNVPKHVLRFWEGKFPHIRPMKRGGGRRYYRPEDMELLRGIRHLLHAEGYTIKGVQKILREQGVDQVKAVAAAGISADAEGRSGKPRGRVGKSSVTSSSAAKACVTGAHDAVATPQAVGGTIKRATIADAKTPAKTVKDIVAEAIRELQVCRQLLMTASANEMAPDVPSLRAART